MISRALTDEKSGFVPAAPTRFQRAAGVDDSPERMAPTTTTGTFTP
jgi:hypothetical protein